MFKSRTAQLIYQTVYLTLGLVGFVASLGIFDNMNMIRWDFYVHFTNISNFLCIGVMLAAVFVLVFQGGIVLIAQAAAPFLTDYVIGEMTCVGSILIMALGMNIIGVTNFKVMNYLPAIFIPILLCTFM